MEIILVICALIKRHSTLLTMPRPRSIGHNRSGAAGAAAGPPAPRGTGTGQELGELSQPQFTQTGGAGA